MELVDQFDEDGTLENGEVISSLQLHLVTSSHYENQEEGEKLVKHMNGFKDLLRFHKNNEQMSKKVHKSLTTATDAVIENWE